MFVEIDRNSNVSIKKQLYDGLTSLILSQGLIAKDKLPSTRMLASQLDIARNSVIEIYEQLVAEGYAFSKKGKGTFVSDVSEYVTGDFEIFETKNISKHEVLTDPDTISFVPGKPDLGHFPSRLWMNYMKDYLYSSKPEKVGYTQVKGYWPLRNELVQYLKKHKGITCDEEHIFITNGTSGALNYIGVSMNTTIEHMITESPVMDFVPEIFKCYNYQISGCCVDKYGMDIDKLPKGLEKSLIYTSPSHQMPLGGVMPIHRRQKLIKYAQEEGHYIIEDDYDSEFRYKGAPVNALKQLDTDRVIYLGTFSKTLGPGLRMGYMVVPDSLLELFNYSYNSTYRHVQTMDQYLVYRLMNEGQFERHIYKMTKLYKKKRETLLESIKTYIFDRVKIIGSEAGLHLCLKYEDRVFDVSDQRKLESLGVSIDLLTEYLLENIGKENEENENEGKQKSLSTDTLIIGFGHLSLEEIEQGIKILGEY